MPPAALGPEQGRAGSRQQRRRRIVRAAAALASRGGVEAMQMRTVADRAGVALGTLYRYFPSKMDLVVAVVGEELDLLQSSIERRPPTAATAAGRAVDVLMRATRGLMREPELADALIRALILADIEVPFCDRMTGLLLRVADGEPGGSGETGVPGGSGVAGTSGGVAGTSGERAGSAGFTGDAGGGLGAGEARVTLVSSLASVWVMELMELLRGRRTSDDMQRRIETVASRLLAPR
jgi:AcrR family transcriptional regulator